MGYFPFVSSTATPGGSGGSAATAWTLQTRSASPPASLTIPVPAFYPTAANKVIALDLIPNGSPSAGTDGFSWIDLEDTDIVANPAAPSGTARMAVHAGWAEFGTYNFSSTPKFVALTVNSGNQNLVLDTSGQLNLYAGAGYNNGAPAGLNGEYTWTVSNPNSGASAFVRFQAYVNADSSAGYTMDAFSSAFNYDSNNFANAAQLSTAGAGNLILINEGGTGSVYLCCGNQGKVSTDHAVQIDPNKNVFLGHQAALATGATNGFVSIPGCAGTPTGAPTLKTGLVPLVVDTTDVKLYAYIGGAWKGVALS